MSNIIETLKGYVSPEMLSKASLNLGETPGNVNSALTSSFPTILTGMLNKSTDPSAMGGFLDMAKNQLSSFGNLLSNPTEMFSSGSLPGAGILEKGKNLVSSLFGNKTEDVANVVGKSSGIKGSSATSILAMAAPIVIGFFGQKVRSNGWGVSNIVGFLREQKDNILTAAPAGLGSVLGGPVAKENTSMVPPRTEAPVKTQHRWIRFILLGIGFVLLYFFISKSCSRNAVNINENKQPTPVNKSSSFKNSIMTPISFEEIINTRFN